MERLCLAALEQKLRLNNRKQSILKLLIDIDLCRSVDDVIDDEQMQQSIQQRAKAMAAAADGIALCDVVTIRKIVIILFIQIQLTMTMMIIIVVVVVGLYGIIGTITKCRIV
jgi:hypothetical protein